MPNNGSVLNTSIALYAAVMHQTNYIQGFKKHTAKYLHM